MKPELIIRLFTVCSLAGLLLAVGLRLTFAQVLESLKRCRFWPILLLNFGVVPLVFALGARWARLDPETAIALVVLGAAPFAPVVPIFARLARADIALAAGLTTVYPVISAFLTPLVCEWALRLAVPAGEFQFASSQVMALLVATITVPLLAGVALNHLSPRLAQKWLRTVEVISEAAGACSLAYVTFLEFNSILGISWKALAVTALVFEASFAAGYVLGHERDSRRVVGLGTSNRNIALALLVAVQSTSSLHVVSGVVGIGLTLIVLGLAHVGYWNLRDRKRSRRTP